MSIFFHQLTEAFSAHVGMYVPIYDPAINKDRKLKLETLLTLISTGGKQIFFVDSVTNTGNNYTGSNFTILGYDIEQVLLFQPNVNNIGSVEPTLNVQSIGVLPIRKFDGTSIVSLVEDDLDADNTYILIYKGTYFLIAVAGSSNGSDLYLSDTPVNLKNGKTVGKYTTGMIIPSAGKTKEQVLFDIANEYIDPFFTSFLIVGQATTLETGTTISGSKVFNWGINVGSAVITSVNVIDISAGNTIIGTSSNDGTENINIGTIQRTTGGQSYSWKARLNNSNPAGPATVDSGNFTIIWRDLLFWGPYNGTPTTSAHVRALESSAFYTGSTTFVLNTGTTLREFIVVLPVGKVISLVTDLDALNAVITANYVYLGTIGVADAGTTVLRPMYKMTNAIPYVSNHRHSITIN